AAWWNGEREHPVRKPDRGHHARAGFACGNRAARACEECSRAIRGFVWNGYIDQLSAVAGPSRIEEGSNAMAMAGRRLDMRICSRGREHPRVDRHDAWPEAVAGRRRFRVHGRARGFHHFTSAGRRRVFVPVAAGAYASEYRRHALDWYLVSALGGGA